MPVMARILFTMAQQYLVKLFDVILCERNVLPRSEYQIHEFSVTSNLLFTPGAKRLDREIGE